MLVENEMGNGHGCVYMISSIGDEPVLTDMLQWAFEKADMAPSTYIVVDADKAEANAIRAIGSTPVICYFHFCQALKRRLDTTGNGGLPEDAADEFWQLVRAAQDEEDPAAFAIKHGRLITFLEGVDGAVKFKDYWVETWASDEMCRKWARFGHPGLKRQARTNNLLERYAIHHLLR